MLTQATALQPEIESRDSPLDRRKRAAALIQSWLDDHSEHDTRFWPILEEELRDSRLRCRE